MWLYPDTYIWDLYIYALNILYSYIYFKYNYQRKLSWYKEVYSGFLVWVILLTMSIREKVILLVWDIKLNKWPNIFGCYFNFFPPLRSAHSRGADENYQNRFLWDQWFGFTTRKVCIFLIGLCKLFDGLLFCLWKIVESIICSTLSFLVND